MLESTVFWGAILLIGIVIGYSSAFLFNRKQQYYSALACIILVGLGIRIFCSLDPIVHKWDERYHALVAKNLIETPFVPKLYKEHLQDYDYKKWRANKIWLHKQPFSLWTMALSLKAFGINEISLRLPSILLSTIGIFLTFLIGKQLYDEKIGLFAAFFFSINGLIIELTAGRVSTDHVDIFFMFLILLSI